MFTNEIKKRGFYRYDTGKEGANNELDQTREEVNEFKSNLNDLEFTAAKFEHPDATIASRAQIEIIETELQAMSALWGHIGVCQDQFEAYQNTNWEDLVTDDMEEAVKKLQKSLKEMKVDKRSNTYTGILETIK